MSTKFQHPFWRRSRASWRDTLLLTKQFAWPLCIFALSVVGGGIIYHRLTNDAGEALRSLTNAISPLVNIKTQ